MKQTIILLLFIFSISFVQAQDKGPEPDIEIGIIEHLGDTIPLDLWFLDENNDTIVLGEVIDKPTILSFVYFDCPGICSPLMSGIQEVEERLDLELGKDYQILTISFNTKDSPVKAKEKKKNFAVKYKKEDLDSTQNALESVQYIDNHESWMFLTGNQENINTITNTVGFKYKPQGLDFLHPGALIVVSPNGKITRYLFGIQFNQFDVKLAINEAQDGIERSTRSKLLKYCFSYDSNSKTYRVQVTRIVATIMLAIAIPFLIILIVRNKRKKIDKTE